MIYIYILDMYLCTYIYKYIVHIIYIYIYIAMKLYSIYNFELPRIDFTSILAPRNTWLANMGKSAIEGPGWLVARGYQRAPWKKNSTVMLLLGRTPSNSQCVAHHFPQSPALQFQPAQPCVIFSQAANGCAAPSLTCISGASIFPLAPDERDRGGTYTNILSGRACKTYNANETYVICAPNAYETYMFTFVKRM